MPEVDTPQKPTMTPSTPENRRRKTTTRKRANGQVDASTSKDAAAGSDKAQKRAKLDDTEDTVTPQRRQAACEICRIRKVKCDKKRPACKFCSSTGQNCEYPEDEDKLTLRAATNTILDRFEQLNREFQNVKRQLDAVSHSGIPDLSKSTLTGTQNPESENPNQTEQPKRPSGDVPLESSRDFLQIPPHPASADTVLMWPVFEKLFPANALIGDLFHAESADGRQSPQDSPVQHSLVPLEEEKIPFLVDRFLQNVHTKNPILNVEALVKHARKCADTGVGWDAQSCLVLIACALGSVVKPFSRHPVSAILLQGENGQEKVSSSKLYAKELEEGESCFTMACRRLGTLKYSLLGAHCYFFAGVYLMYTLRPLDSWHYFLHASVFFQVHLKMTHGLSGDPEEVLSAALRNVNAPSRKSKRLEQSLYWSCFKSECEFRVELPLLQSEISLGEYPDLFPSPPSPIASDIPESTSDSAAYQAMEEELELRRHAVRLCNEEESWYYYLTEIALRRIGNRIINTFFRQEPPSWLKNLKPLLYMAREFESQVSSWSAHLPPAMQQYETNSIIRAPHLSFQNEEDPNHVSRELSWAVDNRLLEMQTWLYQPFLYFFIHSQTPYNVSSEQATAGGSEPRISSLLNSFSPLSSQAGSSLQPTTMDLGQPSLVAMDVEDFKLFHSLVHSGIQCCLKTIEVRCRGHRHHGLWFDLRSVMTSSLVLLALVKCGQEVWIPGGVKALWGADGSHHTSYDAETIGGKIGMVLEQFEFWADEMPSLRKYKSVLEAAVHDAKHSNHRNISS